MQPGQIRPLFFNNPRKNLIVHGLAALNPQHCLPHQHGPQDRQTCPQNRPHDTPWHNRIDLRKGKAPYTVHLTVTNNLDHDIREPHKHHHQLVHLFHERCPKPPNGENDPRGHYVRDTPQVALHPKECKCDHKPQHSLKPKHQNNAPLDPPHRKRGQQEKNDTGQEGALEYQFGGRAQRQRCIEHHHEPPRSRDLCKCVGKNNRPPEVCRSRAAHLGPRHLVVGAFESEPHRVLPLGPRLEECLNVPLIIGAIVLDP
mmetsp:Transcript_1400/g.3345  ORF Transcript_1400/g.3345 Transcript_1400/m.3345 type:complete len:257 (+) Transcript_1400:4155-4925(+)